MNRSMLQCIKGFDMVLPCITAYCSV